MNWYEPAPLANQRGEPRLYIEVPSSKSSVSVEARRGKDLPGGELLIRPPGNHWGSRVGSPPSGQGGTPCLWAATPPCPVAPPREGKVRRTNRVPSFNGPRSNRDSFGEPQRGGEAWARGHQASLGRGSFGPSALGGKRGARRALPA